MTDPFKPAEGMPATVVSPEAQGFVREESAKIPGRYWEGVRRTLARLLETSAQVVRECDEMLQWCEHAEGCKGKDSPTEPCLRECPHREFRISFAVIRANMMQHVGKYKLPSPTTEGILLPVSREFLDSMIGELELLRQRDDWRTEKYGERLEGAPKSRTIIVEREEP